MSNHFTFYDEDAVTWLFWYLSQYFGSQEAAAGIMGNLWVESHCCPFELETHERDYEYCWNVLVQDIRNQTETEFATSVYGGYWYNGKWYNARGFGLAQWTDEGRKRSLWRWNNSHGLLGDMQRDTSYLCHDLDTWDPTVGQVLHNNPTIEQASDIVLSKFEIPRDWQSQIASRREYSRNMYADFTGTTPPPSPPDPVYPPEPVPPPTPGFQRLPIYQYFKLKEAGKQNGRPKH